MKKIFTLLAVAFIALSANAQVISWTADDVTAAADLADGTVFSNGDFKLTLKNENKKMAIDKNSQYFGTATDYQNFAARLKTGGKSDSKQHLLLTIPADGTLKAYIRSGSSSDARVVIMEQGGEQIYNAAAKDGDAVTATISGEDKSVFPVISVGVKAGEVKLTYTDGAMYVYAFEFVADAQGGNGGSDEPETYVAATDALAAEFAAVVNAAGVATNVVNGNSVVKFSTASVEGEGVGSADPADLAEGGQDITVGAVISADDHTFELISINSTKDIKWARANQGDIDYSYVTGTGTPAVSMVAEEIVTDGTPTGKYRVKVTPFDPAVGGEPASCLYYKFTVKQDGALKIGIWANKGNRTTFVVDGETKQVSDYLVEGYINGQNYTEADGVDAELVGKKKWLTNDEIRALGNTPYVIGAGNQPFWGNVIIDAKKDKTYWLFQGTAQIGFQGFTFAPGKAKEDLVTTAVEPIHNVVAPVWNENAPIYNLAGQRVGRDYKGIVIQNGRKFFQK